MERLESGAAAQAERTGAIEADLAALSERSISLARRADELESGVRAQEGVNASCAGSVADLNSRFAPPSLPFSNYHESEPFLSNAERRIGRRAPESADQKDKQFYFYFRKIWGLDSEDVQRRYYDSYLPYLPRDDRYPVLDIGCGSGEFLSFLREHGIGAMGIDTNGEEVNGCAARGLAASQADAVEFLKGYSGRLSCISLLQVIEHIPLDRHLDLLLLSREKLSDGGVLIVETINPAHPLALNGFFSDPTHIRPIPMEYLAFLAQWSGFPRVGVLRLGPLPVYMSQTRDPQFYYYNYAILAYKSEHVRQVSP
jgi:O-antigen chain-terminating methyltransferase